MLRLSNYAFHTGLCKQVRPEQLAALRTHTPQDGLCKWYTVNQLTCEETVCMSGTCQQLCIIAHSELVSYKQRHMQTYVEVQTLFVVGSVLKRNTHTHILTIQNPPVHHPGAAKSKDMLKISTDESITPHVQLNSP